ncbi:dTDP-4-dehydrorhamnose 3,5-epimerase [Micromonospora sp. WMMD882]|uniref:dTDP-4-dehydrorhamnose 3,5-epimerase family protein n=1 Tax=Micromonospora sp. WMMD882 TaxID=3015151 RepID=UPI00248D1CBE|nr:dTDP-4-dehydrorhamnose 3,5-epimerase [Micromonospora sp. WMMD882]WBB78705.1 dTDP-4-dehydrorhamnose 3,5-epimerase [Micromonospora sp. WMMD882]
MKVRELAVAGAFEFTPSVLPDNRGVFAELSRTGWWREVLGRDMPVAQVNTTINHRNVVRGVHFTRLVGQAKFVCCVYGAMNDVIVDTRVGSPTFGTFDCVRLDSEALRVVYLPEGVGHGIASLAEQTTAFYLCSDTYDPGNEYGIHPLDPELGIDWRGMLDGAEPILSVRDRTAPTLRAVREQGLLPAYEECLEVYRTVGAAGRRPDAAGPAGRPAA